MNLAPIVARLRDECPALKLVGGAAEWAAARRALTTTPAAFVLPATDSASASPFANLVVEQRVSSDFIVAIAVLNLADGEGAAAVESLEPVRVAIRQALLAWQPDGADDGCEYGSGAIFDLDENNVLWWHDSYRTAYTIRST